MISWAGIETSAAPQMLRGSSVRPEGEAFPRNVRVFTYNVCGNLLGERVICSGGGHRVFYEGNKFNVNELKRLHK